MKPHKISGHSDTFHIHFFYPLYDWVEILWGFMKFYFKQLLIISAFCLEKQKSFIPKNYTIPKWTTQNISVQLTTPPWKKHLFSSKAGLFCDSSFSWTSFHTAESLHTVSFGWILSGSEWNLNLKFCLLKLLIFYQKFLWNIRSRLKFSTFWVSEPVLTCLIKIFILCVKSFIFD